MIGERSSCKSSCDDNRLHAAICHGLTSFRDALQVTCRSSDRPHTKCGQCKACLVDSHIYTTKEWWSQTNDLMRRRFLLALVTHLKSDVIDHLARILKPYVHGKDYTYTRNALNPAARPTAHRRNLLPDPISNQEKYNRLIHWFSHEDQHSQISFLLSILQWCEVHLIFTIALNIFAIQDMDPENDETVSIFDRSKMVSLDASALVSSSLARTNNPDSDTEQRTPSKRSPKYKDFVRQLPIYLAKSILSMLDERSLTKCKYVSTFWKKMASEVEDEAAMSGLLDKDMLILQGSSALQCNPCFAHDTLVPVPDIFRNESRKQSRAGKKPASKKAHPTWNQIYEANEIPTRLVLMEERNVYCGSYNVLLLKDDSDRRRIVHMSGESLVALSSHDGRVRLIDMEAAQERPMTLIGHAASVHCIVVQEERKRIFTGSYDLTVRCWSLETGRCTKLYHGHERTVSCLAVFVDFIAAGGNDNLCLVWNQRHTRPWRKYKHKHPISAVAINEDMTVSGDIHGKIKLWHNASDSLLKAMRHRSAITGVKFDKWHVASSSRDTYAHVWTSHGPLDKPLCSLRHPKEVLCIEFVHLRLLTGCIDGKIRIWSVLNSVCLRVMRGNSMSDPVTSLTATPNRLLVNTQSSLLLMNFEPIEYDYNADESKALSRQASATSRPQMVVQQESMKVKGNDQVETVGFHSLLEETKELLKQQIRGSADQRRKFLPEEFRRIQQSPFYRVNQSQDDTVYAERSHMTLKLADRPPSSPSRFDLKTRLSRSQSQNQSHLSTQSTFRDTDSPIHRFEIVHRLPSRNYSAVCRRTTHSSMSFQSAPVHDEKRSTPNEDRPPRPQTVPSVPTSHELPRSGTFLKVMVGYVSPYTSPLQRNELFLKTNDQMNVIMGQIKHQQERQRATKSHLPVGLSST